jgi:hypothetical protein
MGSAPKHVLSVDAVAARSAAGIDLRVFSGWPRVPDLAEHVQPWLQQDAISLAGCIGRGQDDVCAQACLQVCLRVHMVSEVEEAERLFCVYTMERARYTSAYGTRTQYLQADSM